MLAQETRDLISQATARWSELKEKLSSQKDVDKTYGTDFDSPIGTFRWDNPDLLWVLATHAEEDYEGSQTQVGLTKDGRLVWEYQSHCSCNSYEDTHGLDGAEPFDEHVFEKKSWEIEKLPGDWESQIRNNLTTLLS